jgi:glutathione synthase/RimK-type ligase-like ATP-grasp enzyme
MVDVVIVTGHNLPHGEVETGLLAAALAERGVSSAVVPWGDAGSADGRLVVLRTPWDYTDHREEFLEWARGVAATTRLVNPFEVIAWNIHKSYLLDLAYAGVPMIPTALVPVGAPIADQRDVLEEYEGEVVIKPAVGVGAYGALRAEAGSAEAAAHLASHVETEDMLVQPFEPTVADGEISMVYLGGEFSHAVRKIPAEGDFRVHTFYGGRVEVHEPTKDELAVGITALAAVPYELAYARVDLLATPRGPAVMEVELIEPQLFLDVDPSASGRLADHLVTMLATP